MSRLSARLGPELRAAIDRAAARLKLGNAEALRLLIVLGLGGSRAEADALNAEMAHFQAVYEREAGRKRQPGPLERAAQRRGSIRTSSVSVRVPGAWGKRARALGVRDVIAAGLAKLKVIL